VQPLLGRLTPNTRYLLTTERVARQTVPDKHLAEASPSPDTKAERKPFKLLGLAFDRADSRSYEALLWSIKPRALLWMSITVDDDAFIARHLRCRVDWELLARLLRTAENRGAACD
jgi:hypothetical protein